MDLSLESALTSYLSNPLLEWLNLQNRRQTYHDLFLIIIGMFAIVHEKKVKQIGL
jgi:hypothetical protein